MKAFLLAAGVGSRLRPYTDTLPKCLIPIHGKPLLQIWLELLDRYRIREVLINIHHHPDKVYDFIRRIQPALRINIVPFHEKVLLGSAGTIAANKGFVADCDDFVIAYADNLTRVNLADMMAFHRRIKPKGGILTMGLFPSSNPRECGIAVMESQNRIVEFIEKPQKPLGNSANGGIYITTREIFRFIPEPAGAPVDMGFDVLPALTGKMFGYEIKEYLRDIGSPESYQKALEEWPQPLS
ncbi:MAG: nucleotidyltransferase family protein [Thermodesulfobacteriota bacterium]